MTADPRNESEYGKPQSEAARRVLIDVGQVLASFSDCLVVVGGWTPDLLFQDAKDTESAHIGSMDVDLTLDAARLQDGRYAEMLQLLLDTKRYRLGEKSFQLVVEVDLGDGERPVQVDLEFLAPKNVTLGKNHPKLLEGFRVLQVEAMNEAFRSPVNVRLDGRNVRGAHNTVTLQVASLPDFLVMKAHAIGLRDKPKDVYDLCFCLDRLAGDMEPLVRDWRGRMQEKNVAEAVRILREKFMGVEAFGPQQLVEFHVAPDADTGAMHARRAYELVQKLLGML
ncbi:MAG: nucleotidyl transferase AbiEii/AbiGii toxin family protein [Fibrobacteria bacterium]